MKPKFILYALLLTLAAWSCTQEDNVQLTPENENLTDKWSPDVEQQLMQELHQLENALNEPAARAGRIITVPAGSQDALAAAIAQAGEGGLVYLRAGEHRESNMITISKKVSILGEKGAVVILNSQTTLPAIPLQAAFYVANAPGTSITGIEIQAEGAGGGTGILLENSDAARVFNCTITNYQFSIINQNGDDAVFFLNTTVNSNNWQVTPGASSIGIVNVNGSRVRIVGNDVSNAFFGIFACDYDGLCSSNKLHGNYIGLILCKVPAGSLPLPSGPIVGAEFSSTNWVVRNNFADSNFDVGYLVIDGANNNLLYGNNASDNARVDYDFAGDSMRFGFLTPKCFNNTARIKKGNTVKDCGENNSITGGVTIDTNAVPCF